MYTGLSRPAQRAEPQQGSETHVIDQLQRDLLLIIMLLLAANLAIAV